MRRWMVAALVAVSFAVPAWANIGRVKTVGGTAFILRAEQRIPVVPGTVLLQGDVIVTPAKASIGMTFIDNSRLSAGPNTRIVIEKYEFDDTLQSGSFIARVEKGEVAVFSGSIARSGSKAMMIRTPKSLYAVRGARLVVTVK
jgi:hypothetical protein